ncbi:MAG: energy transducer TonB [Desulfobacterales bacterium]
MKQILTAGLLALGIHGLLFSLDFKWSGISSFESPTPIVLNMTLASISENAPSKPGAAKKAPILKKPPISKKNKQPIQKKRPFVKKTGKQSKHTKPKPKPILKSSPREIVQNTVQPKIDNTSKTIPENSDKTATSDFETKQDGSKKISKSIGQNGASLLPLETIREARPIYRSNPSPEYPRIARIRGYQGIVLLDVLVNDDGEVDDVKIFRTSGHPILDRAAKSSVKQWLFEPGMIGDKKVGMWVRVPIRFELKD